MESGLTHSARYKRPRIEMVAPNTKAERGVTLPATSGRRPVRRMRLSNPRSRSWFRAAAPEETNNVPTIALTAGTMDSSQESWRATMKLTRTVMAIKRLISGLVSAHRSATKRKPARLRIGAGFRVWEISSVEFVATLGRLSACVLALWSTAYHQIREGYAAW